MLRLAGNQLDDAIDYLGRAVAENGGDANAHWNLGLALAQRGRDKADNDRSTKELNAGLKINPDLIKSLSPKTAGIPTTSGGAATSTTTGSTTSIAP